MRRCSTCLEPAHRIRALWCTSVQSGDLPARIGSTVRVQRRFRDLSLDALAEKAGLSKSILARIERGQGNPSIETLWRISQALELPLGQLVSAEVEPRVRRIPARSGAPLVAAESGMTAWLIHATARPHRVDVYEHDMPPGGERRAEPHLPGTEEVMVVVSGSAEVGPAGEIVALDAGEAIWFAADVDHVYRGGPAGARLVGLMLYP